MNNEIKEILDNVQKCCEIMADQNFVVYQRQDILKVLNYITNLQEERERLINAWETAVGDFEKEYAKNERAKEVYIKELIEAHNRGEDMPLVAVEMYNILEGNKK